MTEAIDSRGSKLLGYHKTITDLYLPGLHLQDSGNPLTTANSLGLIGEPEDWGCSSVTGCLSGTYEALALS